MSERLTLTRPDDWHLHVRDGEFLQAVLPDTVARFARAIIMPNLKPPVVTLDQAKAYYQRIVAAIPKGKSFTPLMTLYLTENTDPREIPSAKKSGIVHGVKYYPAGATTNSESGVRQWSKVEGVLEAMQDCGMPLLIHGEVTDPAIDVFDRERVFIEEQLIPLILKYPSLKVVFEHITTASAVKFVLTAGPQVAATITAHHLLLNRNALFQGGVRPHHYCLPVLKREKHRQALLEAATSANPKFFLGTDSAPHPQSLKENACGCAGIYTAHAAIELYAEAFESVGQLDRLEGFASFYGPDFYGLARNQDKITLIKQSVSVPPTFQYGAHTLVPMRAGEQLVWSLEDKS